MPFKPGQSGNKRGRPSGSRDSRSLLFDELVPHGGALISKAISMALDGDPAMIRVCIDKLIASPKAREQSVKIPDFDGSLSERGERVLAAIAIGAISPSEGLTVLGAIGAQAKLVEVDDLLKRIEALERGS